jgi:hypothetical protein
MVWNLLIDCWDHASRNMIPSFLVFLLQKDKDIKQWGIKGLTIFTFCIIHETYSRVCNLHISTINVDVTHTYKLTPPNCTQL